MTQDNPTIEYKARPRASKSIKLNIPLDTLTSLQKVAESRDTSLEGLLKFYIGNGLRADLARTYGDTLYESTEQVLQNHLESPEEVATILSAIREQTATYTVH